MRELVSASCATRNSVSEVCESKLPRRAGDLERRRDARVAAEVGRELLETIGPGSSLVAQRADRTPGLFQTGVREVMGALEHGR